MSLFTWFNYVKNKDGVEKTRKEICTCIHIDILGPLIKRGLRKMFFIDIQLLPPITYPSLWKAVHRPKPKIMDDRGANKGGVTPKSFW